MNVAILCSTGLHSYICDSIPESCTIVFDDYNDHDIFTFLDKASRVTVNKLIVDITEITSVESRIKVALNRYKYCNPNTHIIIISDTESRSEIYKKLGIESIVIADENTIDTASFIDTLRNIIITDNRESVNIQTKEEPTKIEIVNDAEDSNSCDPITDELFINPDLKEYTNESQPQAKQSSQIIENIEEKPQIIVKEIPKIIEKEVEVQVEVPIMYGSMIIGIMSAFRGSGATTLAIKISELLSQDEVVACVALDGKNDLEFVNGNGNIHYFYNNMVELSDIIGSNVYKYIVIDFGFLFEIKNGKLDLDNLVNKKQLISEFKRCNKKICTTFTADWNIDTLKKLIRMEELNGYFDNCLFCCDSKCDSKKALGSNSLYRDDSEFIDKIKEFLIPHLKTKIKNKKRWFSL